MAAGWDIVSDGPAPPDTDTADKKGWDVVSDIPAESAAARRDRHRAMAAKAPSFGSAAKQVGNLALDTAGAGLGAVAGGVTGVASDVLGQPDETHDALVKRAHDVFANADPHSDIAAVSDALGHTAPLQAVAGALHSVGGALDNAVGPTVSHAIKRVAGDVTNAAPAAGVLRPAAAAADVADLAPLAETPDVMLHAAGYKVNTKNMTGAAAEPSALAQLGESAAGPGARADRILHNRTVNNDWAATDIGLPKGTVLRPEAIEKAESAPGATYDKVAGALPQRVPASADTQAALDAATKPDVLGRQLPKEVGDVATILKSEPMNAQDLMDKISALRQEGYKRTQHTPGAQVDVKSEAVGDAQLDLANTLEKELNSRVDANVPALSGEYQGARKMFAKINTVKRALNGYDVDPAKIAKAAAKTDALDGGLKIIADAHTHAPNDVRLRVPEEAGQHPLVGPIGGLSAAAGAAAFHHPIAAGVIAAGSLVRPTARAIMRHVGNDAPVAEAGAKGALGDYFGRETEGFHPSQANAPELALQPPGNVIEPGQRSLLATGDSGPIREQGGLPPHPDLHMQEGPAFEPTQRPLPLGEAAVPEPTPPTLPPATVPVLPATSLPPLNSTVKRAADKAAMDSVVQKLAGAKKRGLGDQLVNEPAAMVDVYHSGPHPLTAFSDEHMGTGEGNQSFSRGHYTAETPEAAKAYIPGKGGYLMHGQIAKSTVDKMLDWDKPLSEQPSVLKALGVDPKAPVKLNGINPEWSGQELHDALVQGKTNVGPGLGERFEDTKKAVSAWLAAKGIPGAKYLDGKSRSAGKGTRNFVSYNPADVSIRSSTKIEPQK